MIYPKQETRKNKVESRVSLIFSGLRGRWGRGKDVLYGD